MFGSSSDDKNLSFVQIQKIRRRQITCYSNIKFVRRWVKMRCCNRRGLWFPAFSPFPSKSSIGLFLKFVKSRHCVVKGYHPRFDQNYCHCFSHRCLTCLVSYSPSIKGLYDTRHVRNLYREAE